MMIQIGGTIPNVELKIMGEERPESVQTGELFQGKRVVLFALPGAFTPCLLYTSPSPRDGLLSRMPSSA